jgi:flap endonuclease-1
MLTTLDIGIPLQRLMSRFQLEWKAPDVDGLIQFLVTDKGFKYVYIMTACWRSNARSLTDYRSEERVRNGAAKLSKHLNARQQGRLDGFFTVSAKEKEAAPAKGKGKGKDESKGTKRKVR